MIKSILGFAVAAGLIVAAFALPASAGAKPASWTQRTCSAFTAWEQHPALGRLETVVADSFKVGRTWLAADIGQLWADEITVSPQAKYVDPDKQYVATDCNLR
jgi:hypothetical protein